MLKIRITSKQTTHVPSQSVDPLAEIQVDAVPIVSPWRAGRFLFRVQVNNEIESTAVAVAVSGGVAWKDEIHFDISRTSILKLTLFATHRVRPETAVGWVEEGIDVGVWRGGLVKRRLNGAGTPPTHISFHVELLRSDAPCASHRRAKSRSSEIHDVGAGIQVAMRAALCPVHLPGARLQAENAVWCDPEPTIPSDDLNLGDVYDLPKSLNLLLRHATRFSNLISQFSEIHPYAKFACSVLTMACKVVEAQNDRDNRFRQLIKVTSDTFLFLNTLKVSALEGHRQTIKLLTLQTTECAYFIRDYTKQKSFIIRAGTTLLSGGAINDKIAEYQKIFEDLKAAFHLGSAVNTEITVMRIAEQLDRIETAGEIDDLPYAAARFDLGKQCLEGTREAILEKIFTWVNNSDADASRVLLLNGPSGTGKSAIAHTVSRQFNELRRLGSSFFFLRAKPERSPERVFTTIARDMADLDPGWKVALKQVAAPRALRRTGSIREQFEEFILKPAQRLPVYFGPVVIVIDALDAVGDHHARLTLLSLLSTRTAELPINFRIIVTARPDADICDAFKNQEDIEWWPMDTVIEEEANLEDIKEFLTNELSGVVGLRWSDKLCHKLARKSERDFGWAVFACTFVKTTGRRIKSPTDRVRRLLSKPKACTAAQLEAEDSESESDFFHDKIRDKLHIPHILAGHSVLDIWHPQAHKYPDTAAPSFPVASPHVEGPFAPWVAPFGADAHHASKFVDEPEHY